MKRMCNETNLLRVSTQIAMNALVSVSVPTSWKNQLLQLFLNIRQNGILNN